MGEGECSPFPLFCKRLDTGLFLSKMNVIWTVSHVWMRVDSVSYQ